MPSLFQEAHVFISAEKTEDVTEEKIRAELSKAQASTPAQWVRRSSRSADKEEIVVSLLQYLVCPLDGGRDLREHLVTQVEGGNCVTGYHSSTSKMAFKRVLNIVLKTKHTFKTWHENSSVCISEKLKNLQLYICSSFVSFIGDKLQKN